MSIYAGPEIPQTGLVLCLDAANAKSYPGSGTTWTDLSGSNNNGTLVGTPTYDNSGYFSFDFTDDVINIADSSSLSFTDNIFTINFWAYFNVVNIIQGVIGKRGWEYSIYAESNTLYFYTWNPAGSGVYAITTTIEAAKWYNFTFTANGTTAYLYKNGSFLSSYNKTANNMGNTTAILTIGRGGAAATGNAYMNGRISNVSFYSRYLTAQEVSQNFNALRGRYGI